jgi:Predicted membrane protein
MVKYCPKCGYPNSDDANFCVRCGYQFSAVGDQQSQQPNSQPPYIPANSNSPESPKKKIPLKAIIGGILAIIIILVVFLVVLPLISPRGVSALASTAQSEFGGKWVIAKCKSGTASYMGNGEYKVKYLNGTVVYDSYNSLQFTNLLSPPFSGSLAYQIIYNAYPSKVVFSIINGTVNSEKTYIILIGAYWNYTPSPASETYSVINSILSNSSYSASISAAEAQAKSQGICFVLSSFNGLDYYYTSTANTTLLSQLPISSSPLQSLGVTSISALGAFEGVSNNEEIAVLAVNLAPTNSQMQSIVSQFQCCL